VIIPGREAQLLRGVGETVAVRAGERLTAAAVTAPCGCTGVFLLAEADGQEPQLFDLGADNAAVLGEALTRLAGQAAAAGHLTVTGG
jgi:hypothetical protein